LVSFQSKDVGEYMENLWNILKNMMGSYWEIERNIVGNRENHPKKSSSHPPAPPKPNRKRSKAP
jgi:hypothetical protein